jgi:hypothetical protein
VIRRTEFDSDRISCTKLGGHYCNIILPNVHTPREDDSDDVKNSFYEELEHVSDQLPRYNMKILLDDFKAKAGR